MGLTVGKLLELQELGIISSVDSIGVTREYSSIDQSKFLRVFVYGDHAVVVEHDDASKVLVIPSYIVTVLGAQVIALGKYTPDLEYLNIIAENFCKEGFRVKVGNWEPIEGHGGRVTQSHDVVA